jgi:hypothetical protein
VSVPDGSPRNPWPYVPQVGDTVRKPAWVNDPHLWLQVVATNGPVFLANYASNGRPSSTSWGLGAEWVKVDWVEPPTPLPDAWINVYPGYLWSPFAYGDADRASGGALADRIAVLHIWTDADGDHAEIERPQS